jgi:L-aminopeptidase/D-esterase-like protein
LFDGSAAPPVLEVEAIDIGSIPGYRIGQVEHPRAATGCTVVIHEGGAVAGVDVRGGSPGTRDTDALNPVMNRRHVHAVLLTGGSAFGLDAAGGVARFLEERGVGRPVGVTTVPNVCAAVLFDLTSADPTLRPDATLGYAACTQAYAGQTFQSGRRGAGTGARVGKARGLAHAMPGGVGQAAYRLGDLMVGAVAAVNCVGDVVTGGRTVAGTRTDDGAYADSEAILLAEYQAHKDFFADNTVIVCVLSNARLDKAGATKLAQWGQNGIARCIRPAHSVFDGDTVFALCSGEVETTLDAAGILATRAVEAAIINAVTT